MVFSVYFISCWKFLLEGVGILSLCNYSWSVGVQIILLGTPGVLCLFYDGKFLVEPVGISSWCDYSWSIGAQVVLLGTHCVLRLFYDGNFLVEPVGISSWCNYSSSIGLHIVLLGTHGVLSLFYFVMENSCSGQLEFWACAIIFHQLDCTLFC